ncbi:hypothetical protein NDK43_25915 [Neobacillus pocheonensis]|uniref:Uncharacterized protein n=1 Tax=Neobacillus pocheonensis TaxID=363869 RepID=A0ABT0WFS1_9BACI|nr:hypothetical protein [Neobacillus pocheonensis]
MHLRINGTGSVNRGEFTARRKEDIPVVAYQHIYQNKKETGFQYTIIKKVLVNNQEDITQQVREIESLPIPDLDDVFW